MSYLGKVKTAFQMIAIIVLLAKGPELQDPLVILGYVLLYLAAILTLWSMYDYLKLAWPHLAPSINLADENSENSDT